MLVARPTEPHAWLDSSSATRNSPLADHATWRSGSPAALSSTATLPMEIGEIAPERSTMRLMLPAAEPHLPYPGSVRDPADSRLRTRLHGITRRHTDDLHQMLHQLPANCLVGSATLEIREVLVAPVFKVYPRNGTEALHGRYEVLERHMTLDGGEVVEALDAVGPGPPASSPCGAVSPTVWAHCSWT